MPACTNGRDCGPATPSSTAAGLDQRQNARRLLGGLLGGVDVKHHVGGSNRGLRARAAAAAAPTGAAAAATAEFAGAAAAAACAAAAAPTLLRRQPPLRLLVLLLVLLGHLGKGYGGASCTLAQLRHGGGRQGGGERQWDIACVVFTGA